MSIENSTYPLAVIACGIEHGGTTLLTEILRMSPVLDGGFEGGFLLNDTPAAFIDSQPFYDNLKQGWGLNASDVAYICGSVSFGAAYLRLRERASLIKNKDCFLFDKTPRYLSILSKVLDRAPDVPVAVILRDPRATLWSSYKRTKMPLAQWEKDIYPRTKRHMLAYLSGLADALSGPGRKRVVVLTHEEFLEAPTEVAKALFDFIGQPYTFTMKNFDHPRFSQVHSGGLHRDVNREWTSHLPGNLADDLRRSLSDVIKYISDLIGSDIAQHWLQDGAEKLYMTKSLRGEGDVTERVGAHVILEEAGKVQVAGSCAQHSGQEANLSELPRTTRSMTLAEIRKIFGNYWKPGYGSISPDEAAFIQAILAEENPQDVLEIGTASGLSTALIAAFMARHGGKHLVSVDFGTCFFGDRSKKPGFLVREILPDTQVEVELHSGRMSLDVEAISHGVASFGFAFIDANHQHPWPTLDTIAVLPFLANDGATIVHHDLYLFRKQNPVLGIGPKFLFDQLPEAVKSVIPGQDANIFAIKYHGEMHLFVEPLINALCIPWNVANRIDFGIIVRFREFIARHWGQRLLSAFDASVSKFY